MPFVPFILPAGIQNDVELNAPGEANGDDGALHGCVTCIFSRCINALLCGGDNKSGPLFRVSTLNYQKNEDNNYKKLN